MQCGLIDTNECLSDNGGCDVNANCINTQGSRNCECKPEYPYGDGIQCYQCDVNEYLFDETTCLSCPENSTSLLGSTSLIDCKCDAFNHYLDNQTLTCLPCEYGFKVDEILNVCQSNHLFHFPTFLFSYVFKKKFIKFLTRGKMSNIIFGWK